MNTVASSMAVLACDVPARPRIQRLTLTLEDSRALVVRAWLGGEDDGAQLELTGLAVEGWTPQDVTLGDSDVRDGLAEAIADRFSVPTTDALALELLMTRFGTIGAIALDAIGIEGLREVEQQVQARLGILEEVAAA